MMRDSGYWSKHFLDEVEAYEVERGIALSSLGSPSFFYQSPQARIYVDPYLGPTPPEAETLYPGVYRTTAVPIYPPEIRKADVVISTHDHTDHCHEPTLQAFQANTPATFIAPETSTQRMLKGGIASDRIQTVRPGEEITVKDVRIQVFESHDPDAPGAVTYLLTSQGVTLFVSGDTRDGATLEKIGSESQIDLALLAFGSKRLYMTYDQLLHAAVRLRPKVLLPFHWEVWRGETGDVLALGKTVGASPPPFEVKLLQIGDRICYEAAAGIVKG
jgi:L-ascorbate metabolism protein UlaG (beta-lactamase superfamily)